MRCSELCLGKLVVLSIEGFFFIYLKVSRVVWEYHLCNSKELGGFTVLGERVALKTSSYTDIIEKSSSKSN